MRGPRTAMKSGPHLPQLEKALAQKRRPNTAINKLINKKKNFFLVWRRLLKVVNVEKVKHTKKNAYMCVTGSLCHAEINTTL